MWNDSVAKNTIAPLILRIALAVIFIYHGWYKIADKDNDWGAGWATNLTQHSDAPPPDVLNTLNAYVQMQKEKKGRGEVGEAEPMLPDDIADKVGYAYHRVAETHYNAQAANPGMGVVHMQSSVQLLVAWGELVGGIVLLLGLLTRFAAIGLIVIQVGAIWMVTGARGFAPVGETGYEYNVALLGMLVALVFMGSGAVALNRLFWRHRTPETATAPPPAPAPAPALR